ncbi:Protein of unknown function, partial [Gryllus bimaculatus]
NSEMKGKTRRNRRSKEIPQNQDDPDIEVLFSKIVNNGVVRTYRSQVAAQGENPSQVPIFNSGPRQNNTGQTNGKIIRSIKIM